MRFYNSGKYIHQRGVHKDTGEMLSAELDLKPAGHPVGTAIVNFPGHQFCKPVAAGEWVNLPDDLSVETVKAACPSLLTEDEAPAAPAPVAKPNAKAIKE